MITYGFSKEINVPIEKAIDLITEALKKEGFGVLTRIDLKEKFKEKLGIDFKKYVILGACSPSNAYQAILAEENIGLMLPCNVIAYERENKTVVSFIKPTTAMSAIGNEKLTQLAASVEENLKNAFNSL